MKPPRCYRPSLLSQTRYWSVLEHSPFLLRPESRGFVSKSNSWSPNRVVPPVDGRSLTFHHRIQQSPRRLHTSVEQQEPGATTPATVPNALLNSASEHLGILPAQCTGCGALSQTSEKHHAGFFSLDRRDVAAFLGRPTATPRSSAPLVLEGTDAAVEGLLRRLDRTRLTEIGVDVDSLLGEDGDHADPDGRSYLPKHVRSSLREPPRTPLCDRCHRLIHHSEGESIYHPSLDAIRETIQESPYKYNHVYHVVDAADFPMSLLPQLGLLLDMIPLRSRNRRSRTARFYADRKTEISFIITRSDLLAPRKEQVDRLMPYLQETLREALGRTVRNARLGNVRCVSAKRSWWTKDLKEDIWKRGGAGWMVGKVNVGKSQLFEAVFPKGRIQGTPSLHQIALPLLPRQSELDMEAGTAHRPSDGNSDPALETYALLPPARPETNYPEMPVVSPLPGTTASPIRVPFGGGKGELVDLPGLERSRLDLFVRPEHRGSLLMKSRITPEQHVLRPWNSLLLGGFIRLTPRTPGVDILAYAFTPIRPHLTRTEKAIAIQEQTGDLNVENISLPGVGAKIRLAGSFPLAWDVTKARTGPITRRNAANIKVDRLPYRVVATDILIEGCGWVEVVAQVRTKDLFRSLDSVSAEWPIGADGSDAFLQQLQMARPPPDALNWPVIDVYSPEGRFIASRKPMNAWLMNKPQAPDRGRPRRSMTGAKKRAKAVARAATQRNTAES